MGEEDMKEEQKQKYANDIVSGSLPDQESFTKEEVKYLAGTILAWASQQIEHTLDEALHEDIPSLVANCEYVSIESGITDTELGIRNDFEELQDFILNWLN